MSITLTNTSLLQGLRDGDRGLWQQYVERYRPLIVRFAKRAGLGPEEAEDVAQATLLDFSRAYAEGKYERSKGRLRAWLFGIARNQVREQRRRRGGPEVPADGDWDEPASPPELEALWEEEWRDAILRDGLAQIRREVTEKSYEAFRLFALEERPAKEVAERLGTTTNAVFLAKSRILERLRELTALMEEVW